MTPQERLDYLLLAEFVPTNTLITIGTIRGTAGLSPQEYGLVRSTLDNVIATLRASNNPIEKVQGLDLQDALSAMLAGGISLSGIDRQSVIDQLAFVGKWSNEVRDKVKILGGTTRFNWEIEGYETEPTLEQIKAELTKQSIRERLNATFNQIGTSEQALAIIELRAIADELEQ